MLCPDNGKKDFEDLDCRECKWYFQCFKMWQDGNVFSNEKELIGDNFPVFDKEKQANELDRLEKGINKLSDIPTSEQEVKESIKNIGYKNTWEMIEAISDIKLRLRYRIIFLKLEKELQ